MLPELTEFVPATRMGLQEKCFKVLKAVQDAFFHFLTGNFLLAWAGQIAGIENQTMHRFEQYLKILQLYNENSRFPPSFKFEA
jgi:ABC-type multidrug transport system ATPase subunit